MHWPLAQEIKTPRLILEPLTVAHAPEMTSVFIALELYTFTGRKPPKLNDLEKRYALQSNGQSPNGKESWLNWIIREQAKAKAVGYVQATPNFNSDTYSADIAWVVGLNHQGRGFATEAAQEMVGRLISQEIKAIHANINPQNLASIKIAEHLGMHQTTEVIDGETRWLATLR